MYEPISRELCTEKMGTVDWKLNLLDTRTTNHGQQIDEMSRREVEFVERMRRIDEMLAALRESQDKQIDELRQQNKETDARISAIETRPSRRMDTIWTSTLSALGGGFAMWLLTKIIK